MPVTSLGRNGSLEEDGSQLSGLWCFKSYFLHVLPKFCCSYLPSSKGRAKISSVLKVKMLAAVAASAQAEGL